VLWHCFAFLLVLSSFYFFFQFGWFSFVFFYRHLTALFSFPLLMAYQVWLLVIVLELAEFQFCDLPCWFFC
jgi:hypothetical protein